MRVEPVGKAACRGPDGVDRRRFLVGGLAGIGCLALPMPSLAMAMPIDRTFAIFRQGDEIGRHTVRFTPADNGFRARTEIEVAVKVAFFTAFQFRQMADDLWIDGQLRESRANTDDNGEISETFIRATGNGLAVEGGEANRAIQVPLGTMTDLAFWNVAITRQQALVDTQKVRLTDLAAQPLGTETIDGPHGPVTAERFSCAAKTGRSGDIWFDSDGNWVKGTMAVRGEKLDYRLIA